MKVICECGKVFDSVDASMEAGDRRVIRCHLCGRAIPLAAVRQEMVDKELQSRIDSAVRHDFAGLRFDGAYRTTTPIEVEATFTQHLTLNLRFRRDMFVEFACRHLADDDDGTPENEEECSDSVLYHVRDDSTILFKMDTYTWVYDWEGHPNGDKLELAFHMEEFFAASDPKCVLEGEATLSFVAD